MRLLILIPLAALSIAAACAQQISSKMDAQVALQYYLSYPSEGEPIVSDPALLMSVAYRPDAHYALGIGSGLLVPYYHTTLVPVYLQLEVNPFSTIRIFTTVKGGELIPLDAENFEGGRFLEGIVGYDLPSSTHVNWRFGVGFSRQSMVLAYADPWQGEREISYSFQRLTFSIGVIF